MHVLDDFSFSHPKKAVSSLNIHQPLVQHQNHNRPFRYFGGFIKISESICCFGGPELGHWTAQSRIGTGTGTSSPCSPWHKEWDLQSPEHDEMAPDTAVGSPETESEYPLTPANGPTGRAPPRSHGPALVVVSLDSLPIPDPIWRTTPLPV